MFADQAAELFISSMKPGQLVLDIGAGREKTFAEMCRNHKLGYTAFDYAHQGVDWENIRIDGQAHGIWMSHTLEHMLNVQKSLVLVYNTLTDDGVFAVTVPPLKHEIVGGHVSLWNAGLLLYRLILAGFDCEHAAVKTYGYNISVVVRKRPVAMPILNRDAGDIELLAPYFPIPVHQGFDGRIEEHNWLPV